MKVLVTGFDPFGGEKVNPAYEAVKLLPDTIAGAEIIKIEIPTVFTRSAEVLEEAIQKYRPDVVLDDSGKSSDQFKRSKDSGQ